MDTADPRIAAVVITFNRRDEVLKTVGKLRELPERPRIVVVDNGSRDDTVEAIRERFADVQVLAAGANLGAAGRNLGVSHVAAPYVALCDDDTWWHPGSLRRAADLLDAHPRLALMTGRVLVGPGHEEDPTCRIMAQSPLRAEPGMPGPPLLGFLAGASIVRRRAFLEVGGFPRRLFLGGEEEWVAVDLASRGWWLCYVPELTVYHYPSPCRDDAARVCLRTRNALWFAWLRRPWGSALRRTVALAKSSSRDWPRCKAFAKALGALPWVWRERRVVPAAVEQGLRQLEVEVV
jgi:GT2 family glycosyltransferase